MIGALQATGYQFEHNPAMLYLRQTIPQPRERGPIDLNLLFCRVQSETWSAEERMCPWILGVWSPKRRRKDDQ